MHKQIEPDAIVQPDSRTSRSDLVRKGHQVRSPLFERSVPRVVGPRSGEGRFR